MRGTVTALRPIDEVPTRLAVTLCLCGFGGVLLLNLHHLAWWSVPLSLGAALWRTRAARRTHALPGVMARVLLVVVLTMAVLGSLRTLNGLATGATLLTAMSAAKLLETRRSRDWYIVLGSSLFLLLTAGLDRQALWRLPLYAAELWLLLTALRALGSPDAAPSAGALLRATARRSLLALPLALVLFLFFPRLPGAFWALPEDSSAITGLADEMSPGSISQLSESDEIALRVRFDGPLPPPEQRYWRGPVMHQFDGYTWRRSFGQMGREPQLQYQGPAYSYEVTLEPNAHNVLVALELPEKPTAERNVFFTGDYQLLSPRPMPQTRRYRLISHSRHRDAAPLSVLTRRSDLQLPANRNARSVALAQDMRAAVADDAAFVNATVDYFRRGGFEYTLTPPLLSLNSVDDFLFRSHQGFCGHFASAFVTLMRAGGVPARVVTGYLGGEWNPIGRYLTLRQSHAHAWAEVWLVDRWVRVDPSAVVAPERLTRDVYDLIGNSAAARGRVLRQLPWVGSAFQAWEALNAWWQDRVIGFDFRKQLDLIESLGFTSGDWRILAALLGGGGLAWLLWLAWTLRPQQRNVRHDPLQRLWRRLDAKFSAAGLPRAPHEGPLAFATRVGRQRPALAAAIADIARRYAALRFGPPAADAGAALTELQRAVRSLSVTRT